MGFVLSLGVFGEVRSHFFCKVDCILTLISGLSDRIILYKFYEYNVRPLSENLFLEMFSAVGPPVVDFQNFWVFLKLSV